MSSLHLESFCALTGSTCMSSNWSLLGTNFLTSSRSIFDFTTGSELTPSACCWTKLEFCVSVLLIFFLATFGAVTAALGLKLLFTLKLDGENFKLWSTVVARLAELGLSTMSWLLRLIWHLTLGKIKNFASFTNKTNGSSGQIFLSLSKDLLTEPLWCLWMSTENFGIRKSSHFHYACHNILNTVVWLEAINLTNIGYQFVKASMLNYSC